MGVAMRGLILVAVIYLAYLLILALFQRVVIYPGRAIDVPAEPPPLGGREVVWLETAGGRVEAWFLPAAPKGRHPVVIFFHGNGEVIDMIPPQVAALGRLGMHVLLVEYPGYGRSAGLPGEESITSTAVAAYDAAAGRPDVDPARMVAFGRSLGGGAACALSRRRPLAALVLQSTFTSTLPFARRLLVPDPIVRDRFDNLAAVREFRGPLLVAHGRRDDMIPFAHGRQLAREAPRGELRELDCAHNDCPPDDELFWHGVREWLRGVGIFPAASTRLGDRR